MCDFKPVLYSAHHTLGSQKESWSRVGLDDCKSSIRDQNKLHASPY